MPARRAASIVGEVSPSALAPGSKAVKKRSESCRKGSHRRQVCGRRVEGLRALLDRFLDVGAGDAGEGGEGAVEGDEDARR